MGVLGAAGTALRVSEQIARLADDQRALRGHPGTVAVPGASQPAAQRGSQAKSAGPGDGIAALTMMSRFFAHYDYWADPAYADVLAAWCLQTHAIEDDGPPIWRAVPRIIVAGMHGTGKDGTMAQIAAACGTSVLMKVTFPGIRDCIGQDKETVILNEAQATFGAGRKSEDVRMIINAHVKGLKVRDGRQGKINVYGQVAMAGLPRLLTGRLSHEIEDTLSRCLILWKERKPKGMHVPEVSDAAEELMRGKYVPGMREWCLSYRDELRARAAEFGQGAATGLPDLGGGGRGNDQLARPLLAVCDVATRLLTEAASPEVLEAMEADQARAWDWSARIRRALIYVSGVPEPMDGDQDRSTLASAEAELDALWANDAAPQCDNDQED